MKCIFCFLIRLIGDCIIRLTLLKKVEILTRCIVAWKISVIDIWFFYFVELNIRSNIGHFFWNVTGAVITWWEDQCRPHTQIEDSKSRKYHLLFPRTRLKNGRIFVGTEKSFLIDHFQLSNRNQRFCLRLNNFQFVPIHLVSRKYIDPKNHVTFLFLW